MVRTFLFLHFLHRLKKVKCHAALLPIGFTPNMNSAFYSLLYSPHWNCPLIWKKGETAASQSLCVHQEFIKCQRD